MDLFLLNVLTNILSSVLYDIIKGNIIFENSDKIFRKSTDETIKHFLLQDIELKEEYFTNMFENSSVQNDIKAFKHGKSYVSIETLTGAFLQSGVYFPENEMKEKAEEIVRIFLDKFQENILKNPKYANSFLNSVMQIRFSTTNKFISELKENLELINIEIRNNINTSNKLLENQNFHTQDLKYIKNVLDQVNKKVDDKTNNKNDEFKSKLKIANEFFNKGKYDSARDMYLELLDLKDIDNEDKWKLNRNIGMTYLSTNQNDNALDYLKEAYKCFPDDSRGIIPKAYSILITEGNEKSLDFLNDQYKNKEPDNEARSLISNLLVKSGKGIEAIDLYNEKVLDDEQNLHTYAFILYSIGNYKEAENIYEKILNKEKKPETLMEYSLCKIQPIIEQTRNYKFTKRKLKDENIKVLEESKKIINESINLYSKTDNKDGYATAIFNRGVINDLLHLPDESFEDFKSSESMGLKGIAINVNLGLMYVRREEFGKSIIEFEKAYELSKINNKISEDDVQGKEILHHLINAYLFNGDYKEARELLVNLIKLPEIEVTKENYLFYLQLASILEREINEEIVDKIFIEIKKIVPDSFDYIYLKSNTLWERGNKDEAIDLLISSIPKVTLNKEILELRLADFYYYSSEWKLAIEIYEKYFEINDINSIAIKILNCKFNLRNDDQLLELTERILKENKSSNLNYVKEIRANVLMLKEQFKDASSLYKELSISTGISKHYLNWALCEFRLYNKNEAVIILRKIEKDFSSNFKELIQISSTYYYIGETEKALELSFISALNLPNDEYANANFLQIMLSFNKKEDIAFISEDKTKLFRELMDNWQEKFPGNNFLRKVEIGKNFEGIIKEIGSTEDYSNNLFGLYQNRKIPICFFSKASGRNIFETWYQLRNNIYLPLLTYDPNSIENRLELTESSNSFVLDPIFTFTLFALNKESLLENFQNVVFPQGLLDDLVQYKKNLELFGDNERLTLLKINNQLYSDKIGPEETKSELEIVERIIEYIKNKIVKNRNNVLPKNVSNLLEKASNESLNYAIENNITFFCDDFLLSQLLQNEHSYNKIINTYQFFSYLINTESISKPEFNNIVLSLITMNYYFVPVSANLIVEEIDNRSIHEHVRVRRAFNCLNDLNVHREAVPRIIAEIILGIYNKNLFPIFRDQWVDFALSTLILNQTDYKEEINNLQELISNYITHGVKKGFVNRESGNVFLKWFDILLQTWEVARFQKRSF